MLRKNKYYGKFKSHTDVNNYNKFLLDLDKKFTIEPHLEQNDKETINDNNEQTNNNNLNKKTIIPKVDPNILNPFVTGLTPFDMLLNIIETNLDPNIYKSEERTNKVNSPKKRSNIIKRHIHIDATINNIGDLIKLIETYPNDEAIEYNINMETLHKIKDPLVELNRMIGMSRLKEDIVDQILFYAQNLHTLNAKNAGNDFMHTVIYGPPGTGKTEIAKIIGSIFSKMGILNKGIFKKVTRSDLIAGYLGQTALKTRDVIKECLGGVLFIDEAYALGNEEKRDSFSKECIDTLCEALSDNKENLMVIIAGYEDELNNCFFNYNPGLNSRFTWRFKTDEYTPTDLYNIFLKKVEDGQWLIEDSSSDKINIKWFEKNKDKFKFYGRDIETLFAKVKIAHSRRIFGQDQNIKKKISLKDLDKGLEIFEKNIINKKKEEEDKLRRIMSTMYV